MDHLDIKFRQRIGNQFHYWGYMDEGFVGPITSQQPIPIQDQYIRINDKDGNEIFENDIVEARTFNDPLLEVKGKIIYEDGEYLIEQDDDNFPLCSLGVVDIYRMKLVGNVYEGEVV